jgi:Flp pilus assembly protein TadD
MNQMLTIISFFLLLAHSAYAQERRIGVPNRADNLRTALVIGNGSYKDSPLVNPTNDARDVAQALTRVGFEVIHKENLTQSEMKMAIREFGEKLKNGGVGLFYYAGHGMQVEGRNYLIPIGTSLTHENEVEYEAVDVGLVLAQMGRAKNRLNIVILDACRNNPFAQKFRSVTSGLASIDAPSGTLIAYATAPGKVARDVEGKNGIYTQELLKVMCLPGLKIEEVFKKVRIAVKDRTSTNQIPWESSSLVGDFYFSERMPKQPSITTKQPPNTSDSSGNTGRLAETEAEYRKAVWLELNNAKARLTLGFFFMQQKNYAEAADEFRLASILEPKNAEGHYHLGLALANQRKNIEAEMAYRQAVNLEPANTRFIDSLVGVLKAQKKWSEAEKQLIKAVQLEPNSATFRNSLGITLALMRRFAEAETQFRIAAKLQPNSAIYYANLGRALSSQQKWKEAEYAYNRALQLDAGNNFYQERLDYVRSRQKRID